MRKYIVSFLAFLGLGIVSQAQTQSDLRFNEVVIVRDSAGTVIEAWAEIYNTSTTALDMTGLYISDSRENLRKYKIPYGSSQTQFLPLGYVVVHGNGESEAGPLYTNIMFAEAEWLYLVENNGYTVIDSVSVPKSGVYARVSNGKGEWAKAEMSTFGQSNVVDTGVSNAERFMVVDPYGGGMAIISMLVVFSVLVMLAIVFSIIGGYFRKKGQAAESVSEQKPVVADVTLDGTCDEDIELALATVVTLHKRNMHDEVSGVITIERKDNRLWKRTTIFN